MVNLEILGDWLASRPKWQQEALFILAKNGTLTSEDKNYLYSQCKLEQANTQALADTKPDPSDSSTDANIQIRIHELSNIAGVGSIASGRPLKFNHDGLTVVFGQNGTGKTSYVRFLKTITGNRFAIPLVGNVFSSEVVPKKAKVQYSINDVLHSMEWNESDGKIESLDCVAIYDSHCANIYVSSENEVTFEPQILRILSDLANVCLEFDVKLTDEIKSKASSLPRLPSEYQTHPIGMWYSALTRTTTTEEIDKKCEWSEIDSTHLESINLRLSETNPGEKAKYLQREFEKIDQLKQIVEQSLTICAVENCKSIVTARLDFSRKRQAADEYARTCFQNLPLEGIGTETWKNLWLAAKAYSEAVAYTGRPFPAISDSDRCVLCLRTHDENSIRYFQSFEEFVLGKLESEATREEKQYGKLLDSFKLPSESEVTAKIIDASIESEPVAADVISLFKELRSRHNQVVSCSDADEIQAISGDITLAKLAFKKSNLQTRIKILETDAISDNRTSLVNDRQALLIRKWLHEQKDSICAEVQRLKITFDLNMAKKTTSTVHISTKKSAISESILTEAFVNRFQRELVSLRGGHIKVELVKTKTEKSKVFHQIKLKGVQQKVNSNQILSEGENRIVSLAAFLADLLGQDRVGTFIFDDPISSLDQSYEDATAKRLQLLSAERQVIVFTHRLSLAHLLGDGKTLISLKRGGQPEELPIQWEKRTDKIINRLLNDRVTQARKMIDSSTVEYEAYVKGICSDLRILVERMIEFDLLCDVVIRYRPNINTLGKLNKLSVITRSDTALLDSFMSKYSVFEHSNSPETPVTLPSVEELEVDLKRLQDWRTDLDKRKALA